MYETVLKEKFLKYPSLDQTYPVAGEKRHTKDLC
jgi:hypothetical protein